MGFFGGGVTNVGLSLPASVYNVTGSPVTSVGTLTGSFTTQSANTIFAGPGSGAAATPTFRALVTADLPATVLTNPMTTIGDTIYGGTGGTPTRLAAGTVGQYLATQGAAAPVWQSFIAPNFQSFTSGGTGGTYTPPANALYLEVTMIGAGGGGGDGNLIAGSTGGNTTFVANSGPALSLAANGGGGGAARNSTTTPATGGSVTSNGNGIALVGGAGGVGNSAIANSPPGEGAPGPYGGGGVPSGGNVNGISAPANSGAGGSGANNTTTTASGNGGAAGGFVLTKIFSPLATSYAYNIGASGGGGSGVPSGGNGGSGYLQVVAYFS